MRLFKKKNKAKSNPYITIGRHTYGVENDTIFNPSAKAPVTIGNFCSFAKGAVILAHGDHPLNLPSTFPFKTLMFQATPITNYDAITKGAVNIGHDVWVCRNAVILSGVTIGTGAVIGAGAVVSKDVPPYAIVCGNPAEIIKYRFDENTIKELLDSKWWLLPDNAIKTLEKELYQTDIKAFIAAVKNWERENK
ncbi:MAG: CatB-related O-acetyltransferase [Alphaproteobacteria bacterium]